MSRPSHRQVCENADVDLAPGEAFGVPRPLGSKVWVDDRGTEWHRRGADTLAPRQARKLLSRPEVVFMHVFGGPAHEHVGSDRESLAADVEAFWAGDADPMTTFDVGEFRNEAHQVMVMIVEGC